MSGLLNANVLKEQTINIIKQVRNKGQCPELKFNLVNGYWKQ